MGEFVEVPLEELAGLMTSLDLVKEATAPRTVAKGWYRIRAEKVTTERDLRENAPYPGRIMTTIQADRFSLEGERRGKEFVRISPEAHRVQGKQDPSKDYQDGPTKLWNQTYKAVTDPGEVIGAAEVIGRIQSYGVFDAYVDEYVKMPDQTFARFKTSEERTRLLEEGGEIGNSVTSLRRPK